MHLFGGMIGWLLAAAVVLIPTFLLAVTLRRDRRF